MDVYPADSATQVGGNGTLDNMDLILLLNRVAGLDSDHPIRAGRVTACLTSTAPQLLAEGGADKVSGAGLGPDSGVVGAPPVTLPYAGVRAGVSGRIRAGDARVVLGAWWIERHDLGRRDTVIEEGADRGDRYRIGGVTRGLLLRAGLELSL
jgi:hypothetical protein